MTFDDFWDAYPKRKGSNPRFPAEKKYLAAIQKGAEEAHIVSSAKRYAEELKAQGKLDTEFVCMAVTWLNQKRWIDYAPVDEAAEAAKPKQFFVSRFTPEWDRWQKWLKANGKPTGSPVSPRDNGWWFPTPVPPDGEMNVPTSHAD